MNAKQLIKDAEGLRLNAYLCPAGVPTIGYGHTMGVKVGHSITKEQADKFFEDDYKLAEKEVMGLVKVPLTENQLGALTSFVYNLGATRLRGSTLLRKLNNKDYVGASTEFDRWEDSGGKVLNGLVARRAAERKLFLGE
jgi:lysozyme